MKDIKGQGFCDLNIPTSMPENEVKKTVIQALKLGYETIALNTSVTDEFLSTKSKKGHAAIPEPFKLRLLDKDLKNAGINQKPVLLSRVTVSFSDPSSPFLHKSKEAIGKYDLIAYTPLNDAAFKHLCQTSIDVDIISFPVHEGEFRLPLKLLRMMARSDVYFEISYAPCIRSSELRKNTIDIAHGLHRLSKSVNVVLTSAAHNASELRFPYDVINLGLLFGLTPGGSKQAVSKVGMDLIHCAKMRRTGVNKCAAQVYTIGNPPKKRKFSSLMLLEDIINKS